MTEARVIHRTMEPRGVQAQDVAALGAQLAGHGLSQQQVAGILARVQRVAEQASLMSMGEVLDDIRRIQEARLWRLVGLVNTMQSVGGYVNKNSVIMAINGVMNETPRQ